jgi:hypothetical protein
MNDLLLGLMMWSFGFMGGTFMTAYVYGRSFAKNPDQWTRIIADFKRRSERRG